VEQKKEQKKIKGEKGPRKASKGGEIFGISSGGFCKKKKKKKKGEKKAD